MNKLAQFKTFLSEGKIIFFAGSGISIESGLPDTASILKQTANLFLPINEQTTSAIESILEKIQPEVFYESLLYISNRQECLEMWKMVAPSYIRTKGLHIQPNTNHLLNVVYRSTLQSDKDIHIGDKTTITNYGNIDKR